MTASELDQMSFKAIMREAFRRALVQSEVSIWDQYRKLRGTTSHTYNEGKAHIVFGRPGRRRRPGTATSIGCSSPG